MIPPHSPAGAIGPNVSFFQSHHHKHLLVLILVATVLL